MNLLTQVYRDDKKFNKFIEDIKEEKSPLYVHGIIEDAYAHFIYSNFKELNSTILVIVDQATRARYLVDYINDIEENIAAFLPAKEINLYNARAIDDEISNQRMELISRIGTRDKFILVTCLDALTRRLSKRDLLDKYQMVIKVDQSLDLKKLSENLTSLSYEKVDMIEAKGQYSIRGGIVDIFPMQNKYPVRIDLFDDEIDSMKYFEISSQRSIGPCDKLVITPTKELIIENEKIDDLLARIRDSLKKSQEKDLGIDLDKLSSKFGYLLEYIEEGLTYETDLIAPFLKDGEYDTFLDYLDKSCPIFVEDLVRCVDTYRDKEDRFLEDFEYLLEKGQVMKKHQDLVLPIRDIVKEIKDRILINSTSLLKTSPMIDPLGIYEFKSMEAPAFNKNIDSLVEHLRANSLRGYKQVLFCANKENIDLFRELLLNNKIPFMESEDLDTEIKSSQVLLSPKNLKNGFEVKDTNFLILTHKEIFGREKVKRTKRKRKKKSSQDIVNYSDLNVGDYVVHENHGIGQYKGMEKISVNGIQKDYIVIQYKGADKLMIPTDQMNLVQKYIGTGGTKAPSLNKLSGSEWSKAKQKAKKSVDTMADDLVELYAKRAKVKGFKFSKDTEWQRELEDSFEFEETPSQIRSIEEIKNDMEDDKPMDRILCGDVGFGKTEVAIRAAFKAIMDGKQVAFLVPTTILAQQHYNTIVERFEKYPIRVEMLSRFVKAGRQKEIKKDIRKGQVDLVVGTHKILSSSVSFKDLGLLIIDEEQRFGVRHKEKLKEIRENVDVLTLSATPIPRTLQMGLTGIKDMSSLEEPPEDRLPTTTYVVEFNEPMIREAILRETDRGGQVYFIYNNIYDIQEMQFKLSKLVPEISIAIAHGRMNEKELEQVMLDFEEGRYDLLLCTTIVETGLDIQNVNTMIIYNADKMGLSQLYQLKGRIGRSDRSSYAYFTYQENKVLTEISEKRLMAIKDFNEFGSGYKIAMRDLELRGAGNLLGESQHGHIAKIGYDLYVKLLEDAVRYAKGEQKLSDKNEVVMEIKVNGYIPEEYISDNNMKVEIYKKIASIEDRDDYYDIVDELIDRFGDIPKPIVNVMDISLLKAFASKLGIIYISERKNNLSIEFVNSDKLSMEDLKNLSENYEQDISFDLSENPKIIIDFEDKNLDKPLKLLELLLLDKEN